MSSDEDADDSGGEATLIEVLEVRSPPKRKEQRPAGPSSFLAPAPAPARPVKEEEKEEEKEEKEEGGWLFDKSGLGLEDDDMEELMAELAASMPACQVLDLRSNRIGDDGVQALCVKLAMGSAPQLRTLLIGNNMFGKPGQEMFKGVIGMRKGKKMPALVVDRRLDGEAPTKPTEPTEPAEPPAGYSCWLFALTSTQANTGSRPPPPPPSAFPKADVLVTAELVTAEAGSSGSKSCSLTRSYDFSTRSIPFPLKCVERQPLSGESALLGDAVWGAALALAAWLGQKVGGFLDELSVCELGAGPQHTCCHCLATAIDTCPLAPALPLSYALPLSSCPPPPLVQCHCPNVGRGRAPGFGGGRPRRRAGHAGAVGRPPAAAAAPPPEPQAQQAGRFRQADRLVRLRRQRGRDPAKELFDLAAKAAKAAKAAGAVRRAARGGRGLPEDRAARGAGGGGAGDARG